jgi:hypothetical protein
MIEAVTLTILVPLILALIVDVLILGSRYTRRALRVPPQ